MLYISLPCLNGSDYEFLGTERHCAVHSLASSIGTCKYNSPNHRHFSSQPSLQLRPFSTSKPNRRDDSSVSTQTPMQLPVPRSHVADVYSSSVQGMRSPICEDSANASNSSPSGPPSLASWESNSDSESIQASANNLRGDTQETSGAERERDDPYKEDASGGGHVCIRAKEGKMEKSESEAPAKESA